jgi:hypothetical protein
MASISFIAGFVLFACFLGSWFRWQTSKSRTFVKKLFGLSGRFTSKKMRDTARKPLFFM